MPWKKIQRAIGLCEGGPMRSALDQLWHGLGSNRKTAGGNLVKASKGSTGVAFTIALVTLAAKMSKADGVSTRVEAKAFERLFEVPAKELEQVRRVFQLAAQDVSGFEIYASQIAQLLQDEPEVKQNVLECLFHVASADGILHPAEDSFLKEVAARFGVTDQDYRAIRRSFFHDPDSPYEILGLAPDISDADLKYRFRKLVKLHHPDTLMAKGVPEEFLAAAHKRFSAINAAYEEIQKERAGARGKRTLETAT